jgi:RNA polymerase sigma-70 factor (ECF subfamily)
MYLPTTIWTVILQVREQPEKVKDSVVRRYRQPVYEFGRKQGLSHEDSEDVAQEVFVRVCREEFLVKADRSKGKFRTLILAVTKHVIARLREYQLAGMRDRRREVALNDFEIPEEPSSDSSFDRLWVQNLMQRAKEHLQEDIAVQALMLQLEGKSYRDIAVILGKKESEVTNYIHRGKDRLKRELEKLIGEYSTQEEVKDEIAALLKFI